MLSIVGLMLLFFSSSYSQSEAFTFIDVNTSHGLEGILCNHTHSEILHNDDVVLLLDARISHEVVSGNYCTVNVIHSLSITSNSNDSIAHINCKPINKSPNDKYWTRGFAFYGTNGTLTMTGLNFTNCGTNFTSNVLNFTAPYINFTHHDAAVLVFIDIPSLVVYNVSIVRYNGFAIAAVNLPNASFSYLNVGSSKEGELFSKYNNSLGSGVLVLYHNNNRMTSPSVTGNMMRHNLTFLKCTFYNNFALHQLLYAFTFLNVTTASSITILHIETEIPATVKTLNSSFENCTGSNVGALRILQFNTSVDSQTVIDSSTFHKNSLHKLSGAAIVGSFIYNNKNLINTIYQPLVVTNSNFSNNGQGNTGTIYISTGMNKVDQTTCNNDMHHINFTFRKLHFYHNNNAAYGSCLIANVHPSPNPKNFVVSFLMESITAHANQDKDSFLLKSDFMTTSLFHFYKLTNIIISGTIAEPGKFSYNYGSVFKVYSSNVILQGNLLFDSNNADKGAALHLIGNSYIYLTNGLRAKFINNTSYSFGGAITVIDHFYDQTCAFQPLVQNYSNISLTFIDNKAALAGNAVYYDQLYDCYISVNQTKFYKEIFNASQGDVCSGPALISFCNNKKHYQTYPGGTLHIPVSAKDRNGTQTYSVMSVAATERKNFLRKVNWWFSGNQESFIINGRNSCTTINLTIHTTDKKTLDKTSLLLFSVLGALSINGVNISLNSCPLGFRLDNSLGACVCSDLFTHITDFEEKAIICNIDRNMFSKPAALNLWIGTDLTGKEFLVAYCNPRYCNVGSQFDLLHLNKTGSYISSSTPSETLSLCYGSRTGDLCGECITNHSVVFGSTECKICSSGLWLLTSIIYLAAGPLLVFLLYALKLTLTTGTLNGIIFYAQITNVVITGYLNTPCPDCGRELFLVKLSTMFISWLNLNLGFPLCFYNGMTELWKAGLCLVFPFCLLLIVGILIVLSRFSTKVSNRLSRSSIQVLVTVVHLSFTKLLQAVIDVFSSSLIFVEGKQTREVWYNSGAVLYASIEHKSLMIVTSVLVGAILLPYMVLMLFGKFFLKVDRLREYVRPFFEAIHAPYKGRKWYWFALQQLFVLIVYIFETISRGKKWSMSVILILLIVFLYLQTYSMPFKNKFISILNLSLLLLLNIEFLVIQFMFLSNGSPKYLVMFFAISNYPIIALFCLIIAYHTLLSMNKMGKISAFYDKLFPRPLNRHQYIFDGSRDDEIREPLLETLDN